ncbi:DNA polymerase III chi subunit HolC [Methylocella silvestris BL2]|uniref:DNA polymerase III chi subunit HolC n=1 Tax=Methylocella silvestris (strain DSM 15510 / CIP 108128 / LMG 27833 / NCIMB 13906 / BL2) TaxID=395965 RepID=B8ET16_METSB|nr:DNA polymerase III subunit chi [Methylocella silvestris]ACK51154.1 DNA polymerase III chi subunit HolC [Methylocella silvestris BL2]
MEIWFYHLQRQSLDQALPALIEKSLEKGWRVVVQATSEERLAALDQHLWTYRDDSFLAHGRSVDGDGDLQPVYLSTGAENPNGARLRIFIEGAPIAASLDAGPYERALSAFNGNDADELAAARTQWKELKDRGFALSYWQQNEAGRWEKKA